MMPWMDTNEYFLIAAIAKDRVDQLLSSTEIAIELAALSDDRRAPAEPAHFCDLPGCTLAHLPV